MTNESRTRDGEVPEDDVTQAEEAEIEITGFEAVPVDAPPPAAGGSAEDGAADAAAGDDEPQAAAATSGEEDAAADDSPAAVIATLEGDLLRIRADFENFRRRSRREKEDFQRRASERLLQALLPAIDNFKRAMAVEGDAAADGGFREGVSMIFRQFMEVLENEGLEPIETAGAQFDPNLHEAVAREETTELEENSITAELEPGYRFRGRLLKPARVRVAVRPPAES